MALSRGQIYAVFTAVALGAVALYFAFRSPPNPEEMLRQKVIRTARAAEARDLGFILEQTSACFRSEEGMDKDGLRAFLSAQFSGAQWLRVFIPDVEAHMTGPKSAELSGHFIFGRSRAKELRDLAKDSALTHWRVNLRMEREEDGQWRFVWASYHPVEPTGLK